MPTVGAFTKRAYRWVINRAYKALQQDDFVTIEWLWIESQGYSVLRVFWY